MRTAATLVGIGLFLGVLWYALSQEGRVECHACTTYQGRTECRTGLGVDRDAALAAANSAACAVLGSGVTDAVQCGATPPTAVRCEEP